MSNVPTTIAVPITRAAMGLQTPFWTAFRHIAASISSCDTFYHASILCCDNSRTVVTVAIVALSSVPGMRWDRPSLCLCCRGTVLWGHINFQWLYCFLAILTSKWVVRLVSLHHWYHPLLMPSHDARAIHLARVAPFFSTFFPGVRFLGCLAVAWFVRTWTIALWLLEEARIISFLEATVLASKNGCLYRHRYFVLLLTSPFSGDTADFLTLSELVCCSTFDGGPRISSSGLSLTAFVAFLPTTSLRFKRCKPFFWIPFSPSSWLFAISHIHLPEVWMFQRLAGWQAANVCFEGPLFVSDSAKTLNKKYQKCKLTALRIISQKLFNDVCAITRYVRYHLRYTSAILGGKLKSMRCISLNLSKIAWGGVPRTLWILFIWSTSSVPGNSGNSAKTSNMTHPSPHMHLITVVTIVEDIRALGTICVCIGVGLLWVNSMTRPKSATLSTHLWWYVLWLYVAVKIPFRCIWSIAFISYHIYALTLGSGR